MSDELSPRALTRKLEEHDGRLREVEGQGATSRAEFRAMNDGLAEIKGMLREALEVRGDVRNGQDQLRRFETDLHAIRGEITTISTQLQELRERVAKWAIPIGILILAVTAFSLVGLGVDKSAVKALAAEPYIEKIVP